MKMNVIVKNVKVGNITIGEISVNTEYSVSEAIKLANAGKDMVLEIISKSPEIMNTLGEAEKTYERKLGDIESIRHLNSVFRRDREKIMKNK